MEHPERNESDEARIRRVMRAWVQAVESKNVDGVMGHFARDVVTFDVAPPLQQRHDDLRRGLHEWFRTFRGPIGYEVRDLVVVAGDRVAFGYSLNHLTGSRTNGEETDVWMRSTVCFRKAGDRWLVAHEHTSVPLYMDGSGRGAVDLKP